MQKIFFLVTGFALLLTACAAPTVAPTRTVIYSPVISTPTNTPPQSTVIPTLSRTPSVAEMIPATQSTSTVIPVFTPTFDIRTIVTVTPAPKGVCPKEDTAVTIDLTPPQNATLHDFEGKRASLILDALNRGLSIAALRSEQEKQELKGFYHFDLYHQDVTGDAVEDVIISADGGYMDVFYCTGGKYQLFALENETDDAYGPVSGIWEIVDRNQNGLSEIVYYQFISLTHSYWQFHIYEWNGAGFVDLSHDLDGNGSITSFQPKGTTKEDVNHDGLTDLIFVDGGPSDGLGLWNRVKTTTYSWNGTFYAQAYVSRENPKYRYQAIQDGDRETSYGHYQKAIALYQEAIFNPDLDWISGERALYQLAIDEAKYKYPTPTAAPTPVRDKSEYPRLAAYAYYRMMILHTYLGEMDAAQIQYATLEQKFPAGSPGHPYAEMATQFWDAYQKLDTISNACNAAIKYASDDSDILTVLEGPGGDDDLYYTPPDICPFR